jgi:hypothetical protein
VKLEDAPRDRRRFELVALVMAAVIGATAIGFFVAVIRSAEDTTPPATAATPGGTPEATPTEIVEGVFLTGPVALRSGPATDVAIVTRLSQSDSIRVLGRSADGAWLVIGLRDRSDVTGWVPADAVSGVTVASLPVIALPGATPSPETGTLTPDLPDLVISRVFAQQNHLWVEIHNQGAADATGDFRVSVNGADPVLLDPRRGEALRAGQRMEAEVPGAYLQLRAAVSVVLLAEDDRPEEDTENNTWTGIVAPDAPNDVEIFSATPGEPGEPLVVTLRNNSPIPIAGGFTVSVREALPGTQLLGRERITTELAPGGTVDLVFASLLEVDITRVSVILSTDAIDDAVLANNSYPR